MNQRRTLLVLRHAKTEDVRPGSKDSERRLTRTANAMRSNYALLKLVAAGTPRFLARKGLHFLQSRGRSLRHVVVVGSFGAAQQLSERIQRGPDAGMKVIGLCLPTSELPRPVVDGTPVLGSLRQVPEVVRAMGCDAVAGTSGDTTRYNYLRELAWSLDGAGVELLVHPAWWTWPNRECTFDRSWAFRCCMLRNRISPVGGA
jgi:FlaA1/EpsC-like NDP-sugar epimerase